MAAAVREEVAVSQHQIAGREPAQQLQGQRLLPGGQRRQLRSQHRPGPALAHADHPDLRERPRPGVVARVAELRAVLLGGGHVQAHPVDRHQPHPGHVRRLPLLPGQRPGHRLQQPRHHLPAQPPARLGHRGRRRLHARRHPDPELPGPFQAPHQLVPYLAVAGLEEQHHRQQQVHHHPGGQRPLALLADPGLADNPVDQLGRENLRQHPDPDPVRQPVPGDHLLSSPGHQAILHQCSLNLTPLGPGQHDASVPGLSSRHSLRRTPQATIVTMTGLSATRKTSG